MKKLFFAVALMLCANAASAERYVMVHHGTGVNPFWAVVDRGAQDAVKDIGVGLEIVFNPSGDLADMARLIETAAAGKPDGLVIAIPDAAAVGPAIKSAVASGIPVITMNAGIEHYKELGALMHVGQDESVAGQAAGERAKREGAKGKAVCLIHEGFNVALVTRCEGYARGVGLPLNMVEVGTDMIQARARTAEWTAVMEGSPCKIAAVHSAAPDVCEAADKAISDVGARLYHSCNDLTPGVINLIKQRRVAFTIDQQPYFQGYMPIIFLHQYNTNGLLPGSNLLSGPAFVDFGNAESAADLAGVTR